MATDHASATEETEPATDTDARVRNGALLMALGGLGFVGYGAVFLVLAFVGDGFELGVSTLDGLSRSELQSTHPETAYYITHLHSATAGFIAATGFAAASLAWYGVRRRQLWAWVTSVVAPVVGLAAALPMHYFDEFHHHWPTHLAPIYVATLVFVVGAVLALPGVRET